MEAAAAQARASGSTTDAPDEVTSAANAVAATRKKLRSAVREHDKAQARFHEELAKRGIITRTEDPQ